jgi:hypothetical protein
MTYKETLFFIGKCLTINHEKHNKISVEDELKSNHIDWDAVVKVSTGHFVFPALYCNLKRADFLHYLPIDLVEYMKHITDLNRERNQQIIDQAKEINELLLVNNITPIFLKGTGNLLEGLYEDIGERMVGDIDFIFSRRDYPKAIKILTANSYSKVHKTNNDYPQFKHYPRLNKENRIAAIEIHKELLAEKFAHEFNYSLIKNDCQIINNVTVMSYDDQLSLSIIAKQINDDGRYYKNITLRNAYDVFLLSKKTIAKDSFLKFKTLKNPLNCFLAICHITFGELDSLAYVKTTKSDKYLKVFNKNLLNQSKAKVANRKKAKQLLFKNRLSLIYKAFFDKQHRTYVFIKLSDISWLKKEILVQLGFKKTKPTP